jgi:predicted transcriptional regulator
MRADQPTIPDAVKAEIARLARLGLSGRTIAKRLGVSQPTVSRVKRGAAK